MGEATINAGLGLKDKPITFTSDVIIQEPKTITFECDEVIVKGKSLETKWKQGVPLNFEDYNTLVFSGNGKTYTFKKV